MLEINPGRQRGAALFIGLMFLLLATLIGLTSSQVSVMQERMAGNVTDYNVAFQRAERTLREIEWRVSQLALGSADLGVIPTWSDMDLERFDCAMNEPITWSWESTDPGTSPPWITAPDTGNDYLIVDLSDFMEGGTLFGSSCRPVSEAAMNTAGEYFLIVSRAFGPAGSEVRLQTIFFWPQ